MNRRDFLKSASSAGAAIVVPQFLQELKPTSEATAGVALVVTTDRADGLARAIDLLELGRLRGKDLFVKPNFNSADKPPGSTHSDTLAALLQKLKRLGAGPLTVGDRSGMGNTREVMEKKQIFVMGKELNAKVVVFDDLGANEWEFIKPSDSHWKNGFALPRLVKQASGVVQTCSLKTHRFGGHFALSLKNSVGLVAKYVPGNPTNFMSELHQSSDLRKMIAEINAAYSPDLIVIDGVEAFTSGGPDKGELVQANVMIAGTDRIAMDAVGVALLRFLGTTPEVRGGKIFDQEQIKRAVELRLGISSAKQIELITGDPDSAEYAKSIKALLDVD